MATSIMFRNRHSLKKGLGHHLPPGPDGAPWGPMPHGAPWGSMGALWGPGPRGAPMGQCGVWALRAVLAKGMSLYDVCGFMPMDSLVLAKYLWPPPVGFCSP